MSNQSRVILLFTRNVTTVPLHFSDPFVSRNSRSLLTEKDLKCHNCAALFSDPFVGGNSRTLLTEQDLYDHLNWKTLHIHALGNAVSDSSLGHLMSYVNDSDSDITLRSSAVDALAKYRHQHVGSTA